MKTAIIAAFLISCLAGIFADTEESVTYEPVAKDKPTVPAPAPAGPSHQCYDCSFFQRGTNEEGTKACAMHIYDAKAAENVKRAPCTGYCVKDWLQQNALVPYLYVSRYCAEECVDGTEERYGNSMIRTCCKGDLCNSAPASAVASMAAMAVGVLLATIA